MLFVFVKFLINDFRFFSGVRSNKKGELSHVTTRPDQSGGRLGEIFPRVLRLRRGLGPGLAARTATEVQNSLYMYIWGEPEVTANL